MFTGSRAFSRVDDGRAENRIKPASHIYLLTKTTTNLALFALPTWSLFSLGLSVYSFPILHFYILASLNNRLSLKKCLTAARAAVCSDSMFSKDLNSSRVLYLVLVLSSDVY